MLIALCVFFTLNITFFCCGCYSVAQLCLTLCPPTGCSTQGFSVLHYMTEFAQTHVRRVGDAIQPSHSVAPSPVLSLSQHQGLFQ